MDYRRSQERGKQQEDVHFSMQRLEIGNKQDTGQKLSKDEEKATRTNIDNLIRNSADVTKTVNGWLTKAQCIYGLTYLREPNANSILPVERINQIRAAMQAKIDSESWKN